MKSGLTVSNRLFDVIIHPQCRPGVEVASQFKGSDHGLAVGHVSQDPQLQLPVISYDECVALPDIRCECLSDLHIVAGQRLNVQCK